MSHPYPDPYPRRWAVLAVVLIAEVMDLLDATITAVAAPAITAGLGGAGRPPSGSAPPTPCRSRSC